VRFSVAWRADPSVLKPTEIQRLIMTYVAIAVSNDLGFFVVSSQIVGVSGVLGKVQDPWTEGWAPRWSDQ
jgi:hypothetical protein